MYRALIENIGGADFWAELLVLTLQKPAFPSSAVIKAAETSHFAYPFIY